MSGTNTKSGPYLPMVYGGRWAIGRMVDGRTICLIQDSPVDHEDDVNVVLRALGLGTDSVTRDRFFPKHEMHKACVYEECCTYEFDAYSCPTLELLELFAQLGSGTKSGFQIAV